MIRYRASVWHLAFGLLCTAHLLLALQHNAQSQSAATDPVLSEVESKLNSILGLDASDVNIDDELGVEEDTKKKQQEFLQAQQKAFYDGYMNAYNAMRFQQQLIRESRRMHRHRRHHTHNSKKRVAKKTTDENADQSTQSNEEDKAAVETGAEKDRFRSNRKSSHRKRGRKHHRRSHSHNFDDPMSASYFQQYYAHPRFSAYYPYWTQPLHHSRRHHRSHRRHNNRHKKRSSKDSEAEKMRFREAAQNKKKSLITYNDPFNSLHTLEVGNDAHISQTTETGMSGYGPPLANPDPISNNNAATPAQSASLNLNVNSALFAHPPQNTINDAASHMRFAAVRGPDGAANVNPLGVPMPFYPPSSPPPPAPNQVPVSAAAVNGVYPSEMEMPTTSSMPVAMAGITENPHSNPAAQIMAPNQPPSDVNNYPFSASFVETLAHTSTNSQPGAVLANQPFHRI